eukprot:TRINITY_DN19772_c0_g1_i1.p1 TRINITY_DN19772_c0_g1~~TRINITY_DN19772_c0_g1_i1.p1  ORF type:complete len:534 (+),score=189.61 TRINITY_DN19772_c0_g1_i1:60-1604(+)
MADHSGTPTLPLLWPAGIPPESTKLVDAPAGPQSHLTVQLEAEDLLDGLCGPFHVVSIVGKLRNGKSYLLSLLARLLFADTPDQEGCVFRVSSELRSFTLGIDMCAVPLGPMGTVLLLDTEGCDSVGRDAAHGAKIFSAAYTLSGTMLFNVHAINDASQLSSLESCVQIAEALGGEGGSSAKALHIICRDSWVPASRDSDAAFRKQALQDSLQQSWIARRMFGSIDTHFLMPPCTQDLQPDALHMQPFEALPEGFRSALLRLAGSIAARVKEQTHVLRMGGQVVRRGGDAVAMLKAVVAQQSCPAYADLSSAVQRAGMLRCAAEIRRDVAVSVVVLQKRLPMLPRDLDDKCHTILAKNARAFEARDAFIRLDTALFEEHHACLVRDVQSQMVGLVADNRRMSKEVAREALMRIYRADVEPKLDYFWQNSGTVYWKAVTEVVAKAKKETESCVSPAWHTAEADAFLEDKVPIRDQLNSSAPLLTRVGEAAKKGAGALVLGASLYYLRGEIVMAAL